MSRPGDPGRRTEWVEGPVDAIVVKVVELVRSIPGAHSFELRYDAMDRVLAEDEEPRPDEAVQWTATAVVRRRYYPGAPKVTRTMAGTAVVKAGENHLTGVVGACVQLLENLGANVVLIDGLHGEGS